MDKNCKVEILKGYVTIFADYVRKFNQCLMDNYQLDSPYVGIARLFPRIGTFSCSGDVYEYRYHGSGCTFETNGIIISYNIHTPKNEIVLSDWKFYEFIRTYTNDSSPIKSNDLPQLFYPLVEDGVLVQRNPDIKAFNLSLSKVEIVKWYNKFDKKSKVGSLCCPKCGFHIEERILYIIEPNCCPSCDSTIGFVDLSPYHPYIYIIDLEECPELVKVSFNYLSTQNQRDAYNQLKELFLMIVS